jgi:very-short-patch-repair endonuclease
LLIYEAAEGGAGVLSRLVESPTAMQQLGRQALELCHWRWEGNLPQQAIDLIDTDTECEAGCYRCLLSYNNQRDHEQIDRRLPSLKQFLLDLARAVVVAQGGTSGRSERLDQLLELCQSGLERLWLQTLQQRGYLLPDKAQSPVPDHYVVPDFTYVEAGALVFVDGPHHRQPLQQQLDERKRSALDAVGLNVVVFGDDPRQWDAVFAEYRWLFGEGHEEGPGESPPATAPIAPVANGAAAAADLGEQIAAVFAQHADKLGGGVQP